MIDFSKYDLEVRERFEELPENVRSFWSEPLCYEPPTAKTPARLDKNWVYQQCELPWLKLPLGFPAAEMLAEALELLEQFAWHRSDSSEGWTSLCLRGLSARQTLSAKAYGYASEREAPYVWTEIADLCPSTAEYFRKRYELGTLFRVRYMLLAPGGFIAPHVDRAGHRLSGVNFALNNPQGCLFGMRGGGVLPIEAGDAFLLDTANEHSVINLSDTPRIHMIVHGADPTEPWERMVCDAYRMHREQFSAAQYASL